MITNVSVTGRTEEQKQTKGFLSFICFACRLGTKSKNSLLPGNDFSGRSIKELHKKRCEKRKRYTKGGRAYNAFVTCRGSI